MAAPIGRKRDEETPLLCQAQNTRITASSPPSITSVQEELKQDFGGDESLKQKKLTCNAKMVAGIVVGVLVGTAVLLIVLGAVVASHGAVGAAIGLLATKLTMASTLAAHGIAAHASAAALGWIAKILSATGIAILFLGGGKMGGELFRRGEAEQMDKLLAGTKVEELEEKCHHTVTEKELQAHLTLQQATILSSQAGRDFVEAKRRSQLHYTGFGDVLKSPIKAFGHFWTSVPTTSLKSISDRKQYDMFSKNVEKERVLKVASTEGPRAEETLQILNELRGVQLEQLVWRTDAMGEAYSKAPEAQIYDRNIAKLEVLLQKTFDPSLRKEISSQIDREKEKKFLLIQTRLEGSPVLAAISSPTSPIKSLLTLQQDLAALRDLLPERQGQVMEAISILLTQNPKAAIGDVNALVESLRKSFSLLSLSVVPKITAANYWKTRESVIQFAQGFIEGKQDLTLTASESKAPMTRVAGHFLGLRALDIAISFIHMVPVPGSSVMAAGVTGVAVALEKGVEIRSLFKRKVNAAIPPRSPTEVSLGTPRGFLPPPPGSVQI